MNYGLMSLEVRYCIALRGFFCPDEIKVEGYYHAIGSSRVYKVQIPVGFVLYRLFR